LLFDLEFHLTEPSPFTETTDVKTDDEIVDDSKDKSVDSEQMEVIDEDNEDDDDEGSGHSGSGDEDVSDIDEDAHDDDVQSETGSASLSSKSGKRVENDQFEIFVEFYFICILVAF